MLVGGRGKVSWGDREGWSRGVDILLEGTRLDTSSSVSCWGHGGCFVVDFLAVAAETRVASVKDGRLFGVGGPSSPVPVLFDLRSANLTGILF